MKRIIKWIKRFKRDLNKKIFNFINRKELKKCKENPDYFASKYLDINLYPKQVDIVNTINKENYIIVKAPRQAGKTTTIKVSIIHQLLFNKAKIGLVCHNQHNAKEQFNIIKDYIKSLSVKFNCKITHVCGQTITMDNGSSLTISVNSGKDFDIVYYDEFGYHNLIQIDQHYYYIQSKKQVIISTLKPESLFNILYDEAIKGNNRFLPVVITFDEVPYLNGKKDTLISILGNKIFEAEYT